MRNGLDGKRHVQPAQPSLAPLCQGERPRNRRKGREVRPTCDHLQRAPIRGNNPCGTHCSVAPHAHMLVRPTAALGQKWLRTVGANPSLMALRGGEANPLGGATTLHPRGCSAAPTPSPTSAEAAVRFAVARGGLREHCWRECRGPVHRDPLGGVGHAGAIPAFDGVVSMHMLGPRRPCRWRLEGGVPSGGPARSPPPKRRQ